MSQCTCADPMAVTQAISKADANRTKDFTQIHQTMYGQAMGGSMGAPAPTRFCHWAAPEYGNIGEGGWSTAFRAASIAIAIANGVAQAEIASKQQDLADEYYQQAKYKWDRFRNFYMPLEKTLINETSSTSVRVLDWDDADARATQSVSQAYNCADGYLGRRARQQRLCIDQSLLSMVNTKRSTALVDTENYNHMDEVAYTDYKNDQRWNRRSNILNIGRNLNSEVLRYGEVSRAMYKQVGMQIERAASGLMSAVGYYGARNDTYYPTTYLGGSGGGSLVTIGNPGSVNPAAGGINPAGG